MASRDPKALIIGHSFVKRLFRDIRVGFDARVNLQLGLTGTALVKWHGVGGRCVETLRSYDLGVIRSYAPEIVILELGTNDLSHSRPEVVGSDIDDLVVLFLSHFKVRVVGWCCVISRGLSHSNAALFEQRAALLNNYLRVVLRVFLIVGIIVFSITPLKIIIYRMVFI